jgi:hypothetical protein
VENGFITPIQGIAFYKSILHARIVLWITNFQLIVIKQ